MNSIDQIEHYNPAVLRDLLDTREMVFDENNIRDVVLFVAHVQQGKSYRTLARQVGWEMAEIRSSVQYVQDQLKAAVDLDDRT
jgi:hypothetical protein